MASPNTSRAPINTNPCPLAVDADGNPLAVPTEAAYWRVRRDTGGRPRIVNGADLKPLTLPLDYPPEELLNLLGRGSYRLDLCDESGQHLETVALKLGPPEPELRNRASDNDEASPPATMLPATGSDVRLVLEAQVRATQLAFQHNERTLAASLKIAETLRDGVHVLAESQADWIKSLAASRGFFRNALPVFSAPAPSNDHEDGEETGDEQPDEGEDEEVRAPSLLDLIKPGVERLADRLADGATAWAMAKAGAAGPPASSAPTDGGASDDLASRGFEVRELYDLKYAAKKGAAKRAASTPRSADAEPERRSRAELQARIVKDPALVQHLMQVNAQLEPKEAERIMDLVINSPVDRQEEFLASFKTLSVEQAVLAVRNLIEEAAEHTT